MRLTPAVFIAPSVLAIALVAGAASAQQHAGHAGHTPDQHASHMAMMRAAPGQTSQVAIINGQGADTDTLVASCRAYVHALNKLLTKRQKTAPEALSA